MTMKALSERDICTKYITPHLAGAGWDIETQVREEVGFTDGRIAELKVHGGRMNEQQMSVVEQ